MNIYAIVVAFTQPRLTRKQDQYFVSMLLTDESLLVNEEPAPQQQNKKGGTSLSSSLPHQQQTPEAFVSLNMFAKLDDLDTFPKVRQAGDILRAHRVKVQEWNGEVQLNGHSRMSSYLVLRPKNTDKSSNAAATVTPSAVPTTNHSLPCSSTIRPISIKNNNIGGVKAATVVFDKFATAKKEFSFSPDDEIRCLELWKWGQKRLTSNATMIREHQFTLSNMTTVGNTTAKWSKGGEGTSANEVPAVSTTRGDSQIQGDLTAFITNIIPNYSSIANSGKVEPVGWIRLWDGTGLSRSDPYPIDSPLGGQEPLPNSDPPMQTLTAIADAVDAFQTCTEIQSHSNNGAQQQQEQMSSFNPLKAPTSLCGRVINAYVWEKFHWDIITNSCSLLDPTKSKIWNVGHAVRLRNVYESISFDNNTRHLVLHSKTWCTPLPNTTYEIRNMIRNHQDRLSRGEKQNPTSALYYDGLQNEWRRIRNKHLQNNMTIPSEPSLRASSSMLLAPIRPRTSTLAECLGEAAPCKLCVCFGINSIYPDISRGVDVFFNRLLTTQHAMQLSHDRTSTLKTNEVQQEKNTSTKTMIQLALGIFDTSAKIDVIVSNGTTESILGCSLSNLCQNMTLRQVAMQRLHRLLSIRSSQLFEGRIRSIKVGQNKYFLLESLALHEPSPLNA
mmetsp:Transcript_1705/g.1763  ORF Transcript_1705/g.1763 Transcript_1705/m.1763 type:complete len:668 (-) Transcript_1705:332-2335(-)